MIAAEPNPSSRLGEFKPAMDTQRNAGNIFQGHTAKSKRPSTKNKMSSSFPPISTPNLLPGSRSESKSGLRFGAYSQASFFSRHNPHPSRVRHIKGLNGIPICAVHDPGYFVPAPRAKFSKLFDNTNAATSWYYSSLPSMRLGMNRNFPNPANKGIRDYPFKEKAVPRIGLIPITDSWRQELNDLCYKAGLVADEKEQMPQPPAPKPMPPPSRKTLYSSDTGRIIPPASRRLSRSESRHNQQYYGTHPLSHITNSLDTETLMLEMLCQILETDSIPSVQQWLVSSGDKEKSFVLDLIKSAITNEERLIQQQGDYGYVPTAVSSARSVVITPPPARLDAIPEVEQKEPDTLVLDRSTTRQSCQQQAPVPTTSQSKTGMDGRESVASVPQMKYTTSETAQSMKIHDT